MKLNRRQLLGGVIGVTMTLPLVAKTLKKPTVVASMNRFRVDSVGIKAQAGHLCEMEVDATELDGSHSLSFRALLQKNDPIFLVGQVFFADIEALKRRDYHGTLPLRMVNRLSIENRLSREEWGDYA